MLGVLPAIGLGVGAASGVLAYANYDPVFRNKVDDIVPGFSQLSNKVADLWVDVFSTNLWVKKSDNGEAKMTTIIKSRSLEKTRDSEKTSPRSSVQPSTATSPTEVTTTTSAVVAPTVKPPSAGVPLSAVAPPSDTSSESVDTAAQSISEVKDNVSESPSASTDTPRDVSWTQKLCSGVC